MYTTRDDDDVYECVTSENFPSSFGEATITMHFMLRRSTRVCTFGAPWRTSEPPWRSVYYKPKLTPKASQAAVGVGK